MAVNRGNLNGIQFDSSVISRWLLFLVVIWLLGSVGLGWLVRSFFILIAVLLLLPVLAFVGLQWWLQRNLIQSQCPSCGYGFMALNQSYLNCPNCGEGLRVEQGEFVRLTPPGTIDVKAVEVEQPIQPFHHPQLSADPSPTIDVDVRRSDDP